MSEWRETTLGEVITFQRGFDIRQLDQCNISHIVTGAAQPKINQENLKSLDIPLPSPKSVEAATIMIEPLFKKTLSNSTQIQTMQKLRDTLLPKLISGELRVMQ